MKTNYWLIIEKAADIDDIKNQVSYIYNKQCFYYL